MRLKKILSLFLVLLGLVAVLISLYISEKVLQGEQKISKAQKQVNQMDSLFSMDSRTKAVGKNLTDAAQKKIDAGRLTIDQYEELAFYLKIGGIFLLILGTGTTYLSFRKKKSN
jgi:CRISPR/Cas system CMR subunit Cmr6 (Cas7 group RAMP superfamily)